MTDPNECPTTRSVPERISPTAHETHARRGDRRRLHVKQIVPSTTVLSSRDCTADPHPLVQISRRGRSHQRSSSSGKKIYSIDA